MAYRTLFDGFPLAEGVSDRERRSGHRPQRWRVARERHSTCREQDDHHLAEMMSGCESGPHREPRPRLRGVAWWVAGPRARPQGASTARRPT
eukprot:scaffold2440_cov294-Prasinococcus_capsulatus_cf.AAC.6